MWEMHSTNLHSCVNTKEGHAGTKAGINVERALSDIWTRMIANNVLG
jgi:hypothetical protein